MKTETVEETTILTILSVLLLLLLLSPITTPAK